MNLMSTCKSIVFLVVLVALLLSVQAIWPFTSSSSTSSQSKSKDAKQTSVTQEVRCSSQPLACATSITAKRSEDASTTTFSHPYDSAFFRKSADHVARIGNVHDLFFSAIQHCIVSLGTCQYGILFN